MNYTLYTIHCILYTVLHRKAINYTVLYDSFDLFTECSAINRPTISFSVVFFLSFFVHFHLLHYSDHPTRRWQTFKSDFFLFVD